MKGIIDSHAHLTWDSFAQDQQEVIERALAKGVVQMVQAGVDLPALPEMIELADRYSQIYFASGVHPHEAKSWDQAAEDTLCQSARHPKHVAIGECGLDYFYRHSDPDRQKQAFRRQIRLACELDKPLIIHTRDAWDDTFALLKEEGQGRARGVFHCFTGGPEVLPQIQDLNFYVSFSGILTFKNAAKIQQAATLVARERLMVETDCPYLTPEPHRGKRNEPAYVWLVAEKLARLLGLELDEIARITAGNARQLFALPEI